MTSNFTLVLMFRLYVVHRWEIKVCDMGVDAKDESKSRDLFVILHIFTG